VTKKENINDKKYLNYQKKKMSKYLIIILSLLTITLESLALFKVISFLWGLIPFSLTYLVKWILLKDDKSNTGNQKNSKKKQKDDQKKK